MKKSTLLLVITLMVGCSAKPINQDAKSVRIVDSAPANCLYLGEVDGTQGNWFTADFTSDRNILVGARNQLKNEAHKLGANVVVLQKSVDNSNDGLYAYADKNSFGMSSSKGTYSSTLIGEAYFCAEQ